MNASLIFGKCSTNVLLLGGKTEAGVGVGRLRSAVLGFLYLGTSWFDLDSTSVGVHGVQGFRLWIFGRRGNKRDWEFGLVFISSFLYPLLCCLTVGLIRLILLHGFWSS